MKGIRNVDRQSFYLWSDAFPGSVIAGHLESCLGLVDLSFYVYLRTVFSRNQLKQFV